ncbi:MAG: hypothetical protein ACOYB7_10035 [Mycobacterium sp.]
MVGIPSSSIDLPDVLSLLTGRKVRIGEIVTALNVGRSTYYEQRDEGRLTSADNLLCLAQAFDINPIDLLVRCGLVSRDAVIDSTIGRADAKPKPKRRTARLNPRQDLPPL